MNEDSSTDTHAGKPLGKGGQVYDAAPPAMALRARSEEKAADAAPC